MHDIQHRSTGHPMENNIPLQQRRLLRNRRQLKTGASTARSRTPQLRPIAILSIDRILRQRRHRDTVRRDDGARIRREHDHVERIPHNIVRRATRGIQGRLSGSRRGRGARLDELDQVLGADAVGHRGRFRVVVILDAEFLRGAGAGGDDVVDGTVVWGVDGAGVAGQGVGLRVRASARVVAGGFYEVRIHGVRAGVDSGAGYSFLLRGG